MEFEWDEEKRATNLAKHRLDFNLATRIFDGQPILTSPSDYPREDRFLTSAIVEGRYITIVWTPRGEARRVISLRRARDAEERAHRALHE